MISQTGRCLCKATRYAYSGPILWRAHCHCESCRRNTSSPLTTFFAVPKDGFEWIGETLGAYSSSPGVTRRFCGSCGTPMSFEYQGKPDEIHLYAASLDDHSDFTAEHHDFWNERVPWLSVADSLPKNED